MKYKPVNPLLFCKNRKKLAGKLSKDSITIVNSNDAMPRNGDQTFPFRQGSDIFYLTGIEQEETVLILFPDCELKPMRELLFISDRNEHLETWYGRKLTIEEARSISGIETILFLSQFESTLRDLVLRANTIYLNSNEAPKFSTEIISRDRRMFTKLQQEYPLHTFDRLAPLITELRLQKEPEEIELLKKACVITREAFLHVLKLTRNGMKEYEIEAEITHEFIRQGASGHAYAPIVASGSNALCLHYVQNDAECKNGELLLLDFGAEYANYAADLSRTIPVSGRFTPRQKECYNAVLSIMDEIKQYFRPGTTIEELNKQTNCLLEEQMIKLGLFNRNDIENQPADKPMYFRYFMHGVAHFIGLDVHDCGNHQVVLKPGMVLSCEPGIYIKEENIGIRIENDILITSSEPIDLMADIPIKIEEIEELMK